MIQFKYNDGMQLTKSTVEERKHIITEIFNRKWYWMKTVSLEDLLEDVEHLGFYNLPDGEGFILCRVGDKSINHLSYDEFKTRLGI